MRRTVLGLLAVALPLAVGGCAGEEPPGRAATSGVPSATSTQPAAKGGPLTDLPECSAPPEATEAAEVGDLVLPEGAVVTGVEDLGALVSVTAYAALTPIQVRQFYAKAPQVKPYALEDELYEAEVLYAAGDSRVYVKAQAQCNQGSLLSVFVGPEDGAGLPPLSGK